MNSQNTPKAGDRVEVTAAQSYEMTWDDAGDRIVGEFGVLVSVSASALADNAKTGKYHATPYEVRLDSGEIEYAADVRPEAEGLRCRLDSAEAYLERQRAHMLGDFLRRLEQSAGEAVANKLLGDNPDLAELVPSWGGAS
ncbi:hypothetical protein [Streptomyces sp. NBC_01601]|uniref:hypothetical protein n=1 Tax=Streptomyces sp. NBC_01601 TaxID=2975892 RepID=UPI002E27D2EF|nr:hypothetical protein [Streptomyces sp. NBC_01601]